MQSDQSDFGGRARATLEMRAVRSGAMMEGVSFWSGASCAINEIPHVAGKQAPTRKVSFRVRNLGSSSISL